MKNKMLLKKHHIYIYIYIYIHIYVNTYFVLILCTEYLLIFVGEYSEYSSTPEYSEFEYVLLLVLG
jgi:hypothetical protein